MSNDLNRLFFIAIAVVSSVASLSGCAEASFELSSESRLPKWFLVPNGMSRNQLKVTMDLYIYPAGREAVFKLYENDGFFSLKKLTGTMYGIHPIKLTNPPHGFPEGRPSYEAVTVDGITDVIEFRQKEPIFYVSDDPDVLKQIQTIGAN